MRTPLPPTATTQFQQAASLWLIVLCGLVGCARQPASLPGPAATAAPPTAGASAEPCPTRLFNGRDLTGWKQCQFGGDGDVAVIDGELELATGRPLTGVAWQGEKLPVTGYRLTLEAQRVDGIDFFCCLTFPVGDSHCSLVVGGWAGTVVGLSCINGEDASDNPTTRHLAFNNGQWYRIEVEVSDHNIIASIDGTEVFRQPRAGHEFTVRNDVRRNLPLGVSTFECTARIRELQLMRLSAGGDSP
jgi:Domain of Unknown Function (DUF1080)